MLLALGACGTRGNGEIAHDRRELGDFHSVDVGGVFVLDAQRSDEHLVELQGDANVLPLVELEVQGGVLHARTSESIHPKLDLVLRVRSPELRKVELSGASRGTIAGVAGEAFELEVGGASEARVTGAVAHFELDVSGASEVDALELVAKEVEVEASGASEASVTANASLAAEASGASTIRWAGAAQQISRDASGASTIEPARGASED